MNETKNPGGLRREVVSWKTIFRYRDLWMFLSMAGIILYHSPYQPWFGNISAFLYTYSYGGVDVFLFCSGIGCWFSLNKNPDVLAFLKRRANRILPIFLMNLGLWYLYCQANSPMTLWQLIGNLFGHGTMAELDNQLNWYFGCLWVCYLLAPFFVALVQGYPSLWVQGIVTCALAVLSFPFFARWELILWARIPVFFMGICVAGCSARSSKLTWGLLGLLLAAMAAGMAGLYVIVHHYSRFLWSCGGWWYPWILIAPGLCVLVSLAAAGLEKTPLGFLVQLGIRGGKYTLPLSLTHVILFAQYRVWMEEGKIPNDARSLAVALGLTVLSAWAMQRADGWLQKFFGRRFGKGA